jgi:hypothetical protein
MTADRWPLALFIYACAALGIGWMGPWRKKVADFGLD